MSIRPTYDKPRLLIAFLLLLSLPGITLAGSTGTAVAERKGGLKTNYAKIVVANLPIGQTVSMTKIANQPMLIGSNYDAAVHITVRAEAPKEPKDGYSPIPDPAWIVIEPNEVTLQANASTQLDVKIILPNDEKLFGKKYVCNIVLHTGGDPNSKGISFGTEITGLFMFSIAPGRNEAGLDAALKNPANAAYEIVPPVVVVADVKPGQKNQSSDRSEKED